MKTEEEIRKRLNDAIEASIELEDCYDFISEMAKIETKEAIRVFKWVLGDEEQ